MSTYTFNLSTNFSSGVNVSTLSSEISDVITKEFDISVYGDTVEIAFESSLTAGEESSLNSTVAAHDATSVASDQNCATDYTTTATTSTALQQKLRMTTKYLAAGEYVISWSYAYRNSGNDVDIRVMLDDTTELHRLYWNPYPAENKYHFHDGGFDIRNLTEGKHTVDIVYAGVNKGATSVWNARLHVQTADS